MDFNTVDFEALHKWLRNRAITDYSYRTQPSGFSLVCLDDYFKNFGLFGNSALPMNLEASKEVIQVLIDLKVLEKRQDLYIYEVL